jgi:hypothetical protein
MPSQPDLFSSTAEPPRAAPPAGVPAKSLRIQATRLSPEQQRFNRLLARVEELTRKIEDLRSLGDTHRPAHIAALRPLQQRHAELMRQMALMLDERLARKGLGRNQQRTAREILCTLAEALALDGDAAMQALHDRHSEHSLSEKEKAAAADAHSFFEDVMGVDLDLPDEPGSMEEVLRAGLDRMREEAQEQERMRSTGRKKRAGSTGQPKAEQKQQDAQSALRTIFRQLASALHPDRETDPVERARKTALMGQANAAYGRRDLTALLKLQMSIEHIGPETVSRMAKEKAQALGQLLKEQADALQADLRMLEGQLCAEFGLAPYPPPSAAALHAGLRRQKQSLTYDIKMMERDLKRVGDDSELKRWLKEQEQASREAGSHLDLDAIFR